jgi:hypothetical protein
VAEVEVVVGEEDITRIDTEVAGVGVELGEVGTAAATMRWVALLLTRRTKMVATSQ